MVLLGFGSSGDGLADPRSKATRPTPKLENHPKVCKQTLSSNLQALKRRKPKPEALDPNLTADNDMEPSLAPCTSSKDVSGSTVSTNRDQDLLSFCDCEGFRV